MTRQFCRTFNWKLTYHILLTDVGDAQTHGSWQNRIRSQDDSSQVKNMGRVHHCIYSIPLWTAIYIYKVHVYGVILSAKYRCNLDCLEYIFFRFEAVIYEKNRDFVITLWTVQSVDQLLHSDDMNQYNHHWTAKGHIQLGKAYTRLCAYKWTLTICWFTLQNRARQQWHDC